MSRASRSKSAHGCGRGELCLFGAELDHPWENPLKVCLWGCASTAAVVSVCGGFPVQAGERYVILSAGQMVSIVPAAYTSTGVCLS